MVSSFSPDDLPPRAVSYGFLGSVVISFHVKELSSITGVSKLESGAPNVLGGNTIYVNIIGN
jgi:hypothetical protein